tara:strand:+ start:334 stop:612 length:279 start_codon:yes stop_codon:yes gene_type:complete
MEFKVNGAKLAVERKEMAMESTGGILMPASMQDEKLNEGIIISIGDECAEHWEPDMEVIFSAFAGSEVMIGQAVYSIISEEDVLIYYPGNEN